MASHEEQDVPMGGPISWMTRNSVAANLLMVIIIAHIYIGTVGMEGAYDAMGTGEVDEAWAHQHHSIWLDDLKKAEEPKSGATTPAE